MVFVQISDLTASFEFGGLVQVQFTGGFSCLGGAFSGAPLAQRLGTDVEFSGDFGDAAPVVND